jgi:short subunit dehydrogenase-like uncharacterized protein
MSFLLYGANGYTGRLIAEEAVRRGLRPVLAGRNAESIVPLSQKLGLEHRIFSLDTPDQIARALDGTNTMLLAAGPFSATSAPVLEACIAAGVNYLDITGEIGVFEHCFARRARAGEAGIVVLPGVGFDVVPSDCLAATLAKRLPGARTLELAFGSMGRGGPGISRGTARTMVEGLGNGGAVRENGAIKQVPLGWRARRVPFPAGERSAVSIPWGDVSTAFYSTGIPNITVYASASPRQIRALKVATYVAPLGRLGFLRRLIMRRIDTLVTGPTETDRQTGRMQLWGRVSDGNGAAVEATLITPESYRLTAETAVEAAHRVASGFVQPGCHTPSIAFGAEFITEFDGCELVVRD